MTQLFRLNACGASSLPRQELEGPDDLTRAFGAWGDSEFEAGTTDLSLGLMHDFPVLNQLWNNLDRDVVARAVNSYPGTQGSRGLNDAFAELRYRERGEEHTAECFVATHGAFDAISHALAGLPKKSRVIVAVPGFSVSAPIERAGLSALAVAWSLGTPVAAWLLSVEAALAERGSCSAVIANFPANPSGATATAEDWNHLFDLCRSFGVRLVVDDVYGFLDFTQRPPTPQDIDVVIVDSLSKRLGAPGLRLGYVMACPRLRHAARASAARTSVGVSPLNAAVGASAIGRYISTDAILDIKRELLRRKSVLASVDPRWTSLADVPLYVWMDTPAGSVMETVDYASRRGIKLGGWAGSSPHLRLCLGASAQLEVCRVLHT